MGSKLIWTPLLVGAWAFVVVAAAQPQPPAPPDVLFFSNAAPVPAFGGTIDVIRSEGGMVGPVVEGKPYSARSITESTQTLADGNRITQRNEATIYRDSKGRTRREQTLGGVGPWKTGDPVTVITINDPVAGTSYVLDPVARTAREVRPFQVAIAHAQAELEVPPGGVELERQSGLPPPPEFVPAPGGGPMTVIRTEVIGEAGARVAQGVAVGTAPFAATVGAYEPGEDLGEQVLEGLLVRGTRLVDTIPIGAIGNERPLEIVTERWYSPDIDALVQHRHLDPRFGETTYRLVNVVRGEPSPALFAVPQGYELRSEQGLPPFVPGGGSPAPGVRVELRAIAPAP
jgi:hypothetical protein